MALVALAGGGEGVLAVVAEAAGFTALHVSHAEVLGAGLVGEQLGVAVLALVHFQVEAVAELGLAHPGLELDVARLEPLVTLVAVAHRGEGFLAVMAAAAGFALGH